MPANVVLLALTAACVFSRLMTHGNQMGVLEPRSKILLYGISINTQKKKQRIRLRWMLNLAPSNSCGDWFQDAQSTPRADDAYSSPPLNAPLAEIARDATTALSLLREGAVNGWESAVARGQASPPSRSPW